MVSWNPQCEKKFRRRFEVDMCQPLTIGLGADGEKRESTATNGRWSMANFSNRYKAEAAAGVPGNPSRKQGAGETHGQSKSVKKSAVVEHQGR